MPPEYADVTLKPARLLRRMTHPVCIGPQRVRLDAGAPPLRLPVEARRGSLTLELVGRELAQPVPPGAVQWFQNGTALPGATQVSLHLAGLSVDDTDLYYAEHTSATGTVRSQGCLVVAYPGYALVNLATRGWVDAAHPLVAGFVVGRGVGPIRPRQYLLRAVGPSLVRFGVETPLPAPVVQLTRRATPCDDLIARDPAAVTAAARAVGAFALDAETQDFAGVATLPPGVYSLTVLATGPVAGEALVEIYEIDR